MFFCFRLLCKFDVCMIGITYVLVICIYKRVKTIAVTMKFCDELGLAILNYASMYKVLLAHVLRQILLQLVYKGTGQNEKTKCD